MVCTTELFYIKWLCVYNLPVSPWAPVVSNDVLLGITEPSAESSVATRPVLHLRVLRCRQYYPPKHKSRKKTLMMYGIPY
jgi:hypothetical protein